MATRKATEDVMARTEAERILAEEMSAVGVAGDEEVLAAAREVLGQLAETVEYERGTSVDPDRKKVPMRRLVTTGPWLIDPDAVNKQ
jgi:hypothetical protein